MNISVLTKDRRSNSSNYIVSSSLLALPGQCREDIFEQKFLKWPTIITIITKKYLFVTKIRFRSLRFQWISPTFTGQAAFLPHGTRTIPSNKILQRELKQTNLKLQFLVAIPLRFPNCTKRDLHNF